MKAFIKYYPWELLTDILTFLGLVFGIWFHFGFLVVLCLVFLAHSVFKQLGTCILFTRKGVVPNIPELDDLSKYDGKALWESCAKKIQANWYSWTAAFFATWLGVAGLIVAIGNKLWPYAEATVLFLALFAGFPLCFVVLRLIRSSIVRELRRSHPNLCAKCGYNLCHSPNRCPECGLERDGDNVG